MYQVKREPSEEKTQVNIEDKKIVNKRNIPFVKNSANPLSNHFLMDSTIKTEHIDIPGDGNMIDHNVLTLEEEAKVDISDIKIKREILDSYELESSQEYDASVSINMKSNVKMEEQENILNVKISGIKSENVMFSSEDKTYYCKHCGYKMTVKEIMMEHVQLHLDDNLQRNTTQYRNEEVAVVSGVSDTHTPRPELMICDDYSNSFANSFHLKLRSELHSPLQETAYQTYDIRSTSTTSSVKNTLTKHTSQCLEVLPQVRGVETHSKEKPYTCNYCDRKFTKKNYLTRHVGTHTGEKPYECNYCNKKFRLKYNLIAHITIHSDEKTYACSYCDRKFARKCNLSRHIRIHTGEKPYACSYCGQKFKQQSNLSAHIRIHTGEKPYACNYCDQKFKQQNHLSAHIRIHTGEKPYACNYCDQKFRHKVSFTTHIRIHTGEKPYTCNYCDRKFTKKNYLTRHIGTHTGEIPFECNYCNKNFRLKYNLIAHITIHTGKKPYACSYGNQKFTRKGTLTTHIRIHTGENQFSCEHCKLKCSDKSNLRKHYKRNHISQ